ncbi:MAG: hypothetical protein AB7Q17_16200 [Phycisphaerae bacterium]
MSVLALTSMGRVAADVVEEQRITPAPRITSQIFGLSLDFDGTTIAAGAAFENNAFTGAGAVYLFTQDGGGSWVQQRRLLAEEPELGGSFGSALAVDGTSLLIGASGHNAGGLAGAGVVFAYERAADWDRVQTIEPSEPVGDGAFGDRLARQADLLAVSAWTEAFPTAGGVAGRVIYIFERASGQWQQRARLPAPAAASTGFVAVGDVAIDAGRVFVSGSAELNVSAQPVGAVFVYEKIGGVWQQTAALHPTDQTSDADFGASLAVEDGRLAVGSPDDATSGGGVQHGSVYLYELSGGAWQPRPKITNEAPSARDAFGVDVAVHGGALLVGATQPEFPPFTRRGYARLFHLEPGGVGAGVTLTGSATLPHDFFGWNVAIRGDRAVIAAPFDTTNQGAAYIYTGVAAPDPCAELLRGDLNADGLVNNFDIEAFVLALVDPDAYTMQLCGGDAVCRVCRADVSGNGNVDVFDIDPFVACLTNLPAPGAGCP